MPGWTVRQPRIHKITFHHTPKAFKKRKKKTFPKISPEKYFTLLSIYQSINQLPLFMHNT